MTKNWPLPIVILKELSIRDILIKRFFDETQRLCNTSPDCIEIIYRELLLTFRIPSDTGLVTIPCSRSDIMATQHLTSPLRDTIHACDGNTDTFYHSEQVQSGETHSPFFTIFLNSSYMIGTVTMVNVHTGAHCNNDPVDCTGRIDGAKVEVLAAGKKIC